MPVPICTEHKAYDRCFKTVSVVTNDNRNKTVTCRGTLRPWFPSARLGFRELRMRPRLRASGPGALVRLGMHRPAASNGFALDEVLVTASGDQLQPARQAQDGILQPAFAGVSNGSVADDVEHASFATANTEAALATHVAAEPIQAPHSLQENSASPLLRSSGMPASS